MTALTTTNPSATHLPSAPHGLLRFEGDAALRTELVRDLFREEEVLDLGVGGAPRLQRRREGKRRT